MASFSSVTDEDIEVVYVTSHEYANSAIKKLSDSSRRGKRRFVGFDVEYVTQGPNFKNAWNPDNENRWTLYQSTAAACLIQVATNDMCVIFSLVDLGPDLPKKLIDIIKSSGWVKMGVGVDSDLDVLSKNYGLGHCRGGLDIHYAAELKGCETPSLTYLYSQLSGTIQTKDRLFCINSSGADPERDWSQPLCVKHVRYAVKDALMSYRLGLAIIGGTADIIHKVDANEPEVDDNSQSEVVVSLPSIPSSNFISTLNEYCMKNRINQPSYYFSSNTEEGIPSFTCICEIQNTTTIGVAGRKKDAKKIAAKEMFELITNPEPDRLMPPSAFRGAVDG